MTDYDNEIEDDELEGSVATYTDEEIEAEEAKCTWIGAFRFMGKTFLSTAAVRAWKNNFEKLVRPGGAEIDRIQAKYPPNAIGDTDVAQEFSDNLVSQIESLNILDEDFILSLVARKPGAWKPFKARAAVIEAELDKAYATAILESNQAIAERERLRLAREKEKTEREEGDRKEREARFTQSVLVRVPASHRTDLDRLRLPADATIVEAFQPNAGGNLLVIGRSGTGKARSVHDRLVKCALSQADRAWVFLSILATDVKAHFSPKSKGAEGARYQPKQGEMAAADALFIRDLHLAPLNNGYGSELLQLLNARTDAGRSTIVSTALVGDDLSEAIDRKLLNYVLFDELLDVLSTWPAADFDHTPPPATP